MVSLVAYINVYLIPCAGLSTMPYKFIAITFDDLADFGKDTISTVDRLNTLCHFMFISPFFDYLGTFEFSDTYDVHMQLWYLTVTT